MIRQSVFIFSVIAFSSCATVYSGTSQATPPERPKLVIGITVDQMRYDYLYKFWDDFGPDGFKRLVAEGASFENAKFNYAPTLTACGHACIFTGTTPAWNGIAGNDWWDRKEKKRIYCVADPAIEGVGTDAAAGKMSPHRLQAATLGDALKLFTNQRSKSIGISLKDRGAILPAGRSGDAAYWFSGQQEGNWVTSRWYMDELPQWVKDFNAKKLPDTYLKQGWNIFLPEANYARSAPDNNPYEVPFKGTTKPVFPYLLDSLRALNNNYELIREIPAGSAFTFDFARACILAENLGKDVFTDVLSVSLSAPDYVGHRFGPQSRENQDTYARLDRDLADFLKFLDAEIGKGNYLFFLTADHGGADVPSYAIEQQLGAGYFKTAQMKPVLEEFLKKEYGMDSLLLHAEKEGFQIYLNRPLIREKKLSQNEVEDKVAMFLNDYPGVQKAYPGHVLRSGAAVDPMAQKYQRGCHSERSGDVFFALRPGWLDYGLQGTHHGAAYAYDAHVPLLFYGTGISPLRSNTPVAIEDIVPTISYLLRTPLPNATTGTPIPDLK